MSEWKKYRKVATQEFRDYIPGEDITGISVAPGEVPMEGGKVGRDNKGSFWYVTPEFMAENYVLAEGVLDAPRYPWHPTESDYIPDTKAQKFVHHIEGHLSKGQKVICKICGKTIDQIYGDRIHENPELLE